VRRSDTKEAALRTGRVSLLDEAVVALGTKLRGYEQALDAARDELALVQMLIDTETEPEEASVDSVTRLRRRRSQLRAEIRLLEEGRLDAESHLKFMIGRWSESQARASASHPE
jgi:hypothetical protein